MSLLNWNLIFLMVFTLIVLPLVTAEGLRYFGNYAKQKLVNNFGDKSQVMFGGLGVIVHELAHLVTALIFRHHIDDFKLLEPRQYQYTGQLGSVEHSWNKNNWYESLGNFFIGLAPVFLCSIVLWLVHGYLFGNQPLQFGLACNMTNAFHVAGENISHPFGSIGLGLVVYLVLIVMIASTGYGLSKADMHNVMSGLPYWIGLLAVLYLLVTVTGMSSVITPYLYKLVVLLLTFLGRGLVYIAISLVLIVLVHVALGSRVKDYEY